MARPAITSALLLVLLALVPSARAESTPLARELLARILTSELTFTKVTDEGEPINDPAAIHTVLRNRQGSGSLIRIMLLYSPRATGAVPPVNDRQAWVSGLNLGLTEPPSWPLSYPPWRVMRPRWEERLEEARGLLETPHNPCIGEPHHWGGAMDDARAEGMGWQRLECGPCLNHFWCVPSRGCPEAEAQALP